MPKSRVTLALGLLAATVIPCVTAHAGTLRVIFSGGMQPQAAQIAAAYQRVSRSTRIEPILIGEAVDFSAAVGKKPDIYMGLFAEMSNYADIGLFDDVAKILPAKALRDFPESFQGAFAVGKRLLGIPIAGYTTSLYYNQDMFKKAGLGTPTEGWTWEGDFYSACRKLTRGTGTGVNDVYGVTGMLANQFGNQGMPNPHFLPVVYSYGGSIVDKQFTKQLYTEKPAMDAVKFILKLHTDKLADLTDYTYDQGDASQWPFWSGKSAMALMLGSGTKDIPFSHSPWTKGKSPSFAVGVSVVPKGPKGTITANMTQVASVMSTCKNKKEAADFLQFLASPKGQEAIYNATGAFPTTRQGFAVKKVVSAAPTPLYKAYQRGRTWSARKGYLQIEFSLWGDLLGVIRGDSTMADLIENAKTRTPEIIDSSTYSF